MCVNLKPRKQTKWAFIVASGLSLALFLLLQILLPCGMLQTFSSRIPAIGNLAAYILTLILFVIAFCVFFFLLQHTQSKTAGELLDRPLSAKKYAIMYYIGSAVLLVLLAARRMITEITEFGISTRLSFHQFPGWLSIVIFLSVATFAVVFSQKINNDWDISRRTLYFCCVGILLLIFVCTLVLNTFYADIHHGIAYLESIYNVYYGVPYTRITSGIYGYHGLFLAPILHLFNGSNIALMITLALLQCLAAALCFYCSSAITEKNCVRVLTMLMCSLSVLSMRISNYWQVQPHRILWPLIVVSYVIHLIKNDRWSKTDKAFGYFLCIAAVLWNVESGIFCGISFAAACIIHNWQQCIWYKPRSLLNFLLHIGCVIATIIVAILIVNGYNYLCGWHEWFLKDFFFPMFESSYISNFLEVDIPIGNHAWVYVLVLFGGLFLWALYTTSFIHGKVIMRNSNTAKMAPAMITVAVLGLCNFSYYANRAAYLNLDIIVQLAGIALCILLSNTKIPSLKRKATLLNCGKEIVSYVSLVLVIALSFEAVLFSVPQLYRKVKNNHYDTSNYKQACMTLAETIPEHTFAFGGGISVMYAELGWDTIGHYRDMSDLTVGGDAVRNEIVKDTLSQDAFVAYLSTEREYEVITQILQKDPCFILAKEIQLNGIPLHYYTRTRE